MSSGTLVGVSDGAPRLSEPLTFAFESLDDRPMASDTTRGKCVVLAFVATWDLASQAQINYLNAMAKNDGDAVFYGAVAIEDNSNRALVRAYTHALSVTFPMAQIDRAGMSATHAFADVQEVPTLVLLDARGVLIARKSGLNKPDDVRAMQGKCARKVK